MTKPERRVDFHEWLDRVLAMNRRMLLRPDLTRITGAKPSFRQYVRVLKRRCLRKPPHEYWMTATNAIGAAYAHRSLGNTADLDAIRTFFDRHLDTQGAWRTMPRGVDAAMKGYPLLHLARHVGIPRYRHAADSLCDYMLTTYPKAIDGSLRYTWDMETVLVDSLGMVCPFLTSYGALYGHSESIDMAARQILRFVEQNVDVDTHLPYHAYYPDGPKRLGMQGWGRGTGWYMLGLADTLVDLPRQHPAYPAILKAYQGAAASLKQFQRPDGHWGWAILLRKAHYDSSATAFLGYSLTRGIQAGILSSSYLTVVESAVAALMDVTKPDGTLDGSLADCFGVGLYPTAFGPQPWLQGMASAFASLYAECVQDKSSASTGLPQE
jgi:unsaturated rhamnogalacturonyl hydrolase